MVSDRERAEAVRRLRERAGTVSASEALRLGIHPRTLYALRDEEVLDQLSRGVYRLAELPPLRQPDLVAVAKRVPDGVICLLSALAFHELTTQIPHAVYVAVRKGRAVPRVDYPPVVVFQFSQTAFEAGVEEQRLDGEAVRIYSREKTMADCFKFRNRLGLDVALEALRLYRQRGRTDGEALLRFARVCRVQRVMQPYLEALL